MPESVQTVKARHAEQLLARPGVISVGIGQDEQGRPVIVLGLAHDDPELRVTLPEELDGYAVQVQILGRIRPQ